MQQRRLRLGDILDDYCPRERRLTNHAVVAKIDDEVRQTRCLTCDTEHEYRQGKAPTLRKKKDTVSAAYQEVLAEVTKGAPGLGAPAEVEAGQENGAAPAEAPAPAAETPAPSAAANESAPAPAEPGPGTPPVSAAEGRQEGEAEPADAAEGAEAEEARVHRRLIRATLPRSDNQPVVRPIPQFTMRQPTGGRPAKFRPSTGRGPRPAGGARVGASGAGRFPARGVQHAGRPARAEGPRARGPQHPRHGKKHSK